MGEHKHSSSRGKKKGNSGSGNDKTKGSHRGGGGMEEDSFQARPTNRMGKDHKIKADGDTWQEMMAVCEAPEGTNNENNEDGGQLVIRSYYQSTRTGERVWDEPPSGATNIIPASDEVRRMANLQLDELHVVKKKGKKSKPEKKKTLMGRIFGTNKKDKKKHKRGRIEYKPGSQMYAGKAHQDTEDAMMQEAIAASIMESKGETYVRPSPGQQSSVEEEMAMNLALSMSAAERDAEANALAHALSLSAAENENTPVQIQTEQEYRTEEEMLARVMEQSKLETKRGEGDLLNLSSGNNMNMTAMNPFDAPASPDNRKMPASGSTAVNQHQLYQQIQNQQFPTMAPASVPFASAPVASMPTSASAPPSNNTSAQYAASSNAAAAASASQYAAAMAAAASPPAMKAPPSYSMTNPGNSSPQRPSNNYPSMAPQPSYGGGGGPARPATSPTYPPQQQNLRIPVNAPPIPNIALKPPPQDATPFNTTAPVFNSRSTRPTSSTTTQPAAPSMFDPYSKDASQKPSAKPPPPASSTAAAARSSSSNGLKKMGAGSTSDAPRKMSMFKRKSAATKTKVQDKAGLV